MPSPFPGMAPYLEGYLWPDLHHRLATEISKQLMAKIAPRYVARIVVRTLIEEIQSRETVGVMMPDVEVFTGRQRSARLAPSPIPSIALAEPITPATTTIPQTFTVEVDIPSVEIRDVASGLLVTSIEILSPVNKYGEGWDEDQTKRHRVINAQANLLEIDLLRRGKRPVRTQDTPRAPYYIFLTRAQTPQRVDIWAIQLRDALPTLPVPLRPPDADVAINLQKVFTTIYDEARYDLSIDYGEPPDPPLQGEEAIWAAQLLNQARNGNGTANS
ncbi:MAG: DUF4058 family protein [Caldilineaceae bacterium]